MMAFCIGSRSLRIVGAPVLLLASLAAGTDSSVHLEDAHALLGQDCKGSLVSQARKVEDAKASVTRIQTGIENRMTDLSQLRKLVTQLDKVLANEVADVKAASTIRGMDMARYKIGRATSPMDLKRVLMNYGVRGEDTEKTSIQEYEKLLRNITASSARASQSRDDNLAQIGMLLQLADSRETAEHSTNVSELRASNAKFEKLLADDLADIKAASIVRGMELTAFNHRNTDFATIGDEISLGKGIKDDADDVTSRPQYEELVRKMDAEVVRVSHDRDIALETSGGMLQKFKALDSQLPAATATLAADKQSLSELRAICAVQDLLEGPPEEPVAAGYSLVMV